MLTTKKFSFQLYCNNLNKQVVRYYSGNLFTRAEEKYIKTFSPENQEVLMKCKNNHNVLFQLRDRLVIVSPNKIEGNELNDNLGKALTNKLTIKLFGKSHPELYNATAEYESLAKANQSFILKKPGNLKEEFTEVISFFSLGKTSEKLVLPIFETYEEILKDTNVTHRAAFYLVTVISEVILPQLVHKATTAGFSTAEIVNYIYSFTVNGDENRNLTKYLNNIDFTEVLSGKNLEILFYRSFFLKSLYQSTTVSEQVSITRELLCSIPSNFCEASFFLPYYESELIFISLLQIIFYYIYILIIIRIKKKNFLQQIKNDV